MSLKMVLSDFLNLLEKIEMRRKLNEDAYELEFQRLKMLTENLKHNPDYSCKHGAQEVNRCKNRYKDILPYDYTRVILSEDSDKPGSDYTNANYIKGANGSAAYIACQGPLPHTVVDFWRMIWECEVKVVVMACNERESGKQKCENYWPEDEAKDFGNFHIELVKTQYVCDDFLVRMLKACHEDKERTVYQFHYTTWPDHGVPTSVEPILHLIQLVRKFQASDSVPILVHCSAGCGRTGTICAIDYVWRLMISGKLKEPFNLYEIISRMRQQRIAMVQTKEQYILVHRAVAALFEQQLELIANHFYENIGEDGLPLLPAVEEEENIYEEVNCESVNSNSSHLQIAESDEQQQQEKIINESQKECLPVDDRSHSKIVLSQSAVSSIGKNYAKINDDQKYLHELSIDKITESSAHEQNVNFTLSLPLSTTTQKSKKSLVFVNTDQNTNFNVENCVSCNVKIDSEGKVQILQQKDDCSLSDSQCYTNSDEKTDCNTGNLHSAIITNTCSSSDILVPCQIAENSNVLSFEESVEKCENKYCNIKEKHADIEEIFQRILNNSQNQMNAELVTSGKHSVKSSSSFEEISKISTTSVMEVNKSSLVTETFRSELDNIKRENTQNECVEIPVKHDENKIDDNAISDETFKDIVLHDLTSDSTQASRKRYMSLVTECEQSFSEIERLLEEKNKILTFENSNNKENCDITLPAVRNCNSTCQTTYCSIPHNALDSNKISTQQITNYSFVPDKDTTENLKTNKSASLQNSFLNISDTWKQEEKGDIRTLSCNNLHSQDNLFLTKNNISTENTKQECSGIEEALKMNQTHNESLEYIDSTVTCQDIDQEINVNEQLEMKRSFSETEINKFGSISEKINETKENILRCRKEVNETMPPDIKIIKCHVRTEMCRKEEVAHKRTGKIFEHEEIFPHFNQENSSNANISQKSKENNELSFPCKESLNKPKKEKENSQLNLQVGPTHNTHNCENNLESDQSENTVNYAITEASGTKATVVRRPSIAKLKALFEKTASTVSQYDKQHHERHHPLSRSQSHHIHRYKHSEKDSIKEKYSTKPTLLNKVTKILHLPSVENNYCQADNNRFSVQWKSSDMEAISLSFEAKEIPKPLVDTKENEKSERHNFLKDNTSSEKLSNCSLSSDTNDICSAIGKCEDEESISERSGVGCLDFSSLMSVVTKEQNSNKTHWYKHERDEQDNEDQTLSDKKVPHTEETKENCNDNNDKLSKEVKTRCISVIDSVEFPYKLLKMKNEKNNDLPPELPSKKKNQNTSFYSYLNDKDYTDNNNQNFSQDSTIGKTKWYYENDENNSTTSMEKIESFCNENIACSNINDNSSNNNTCSISEQNKYQLSSSCLQKSINSYISEHSTDTSVQCCDLQPPLPPKKKSNDIERIENTNWYCNEIKTVGNHIKSKGIQNKSPVFHPYANVLKTKDGILIADEEETHQLLYNATQSKPDLYTNINTTSLKNIEQIENSLHHHPRGAIIDLTSRQSYANEQQSDIKSIKYGSDPKLSETVITTDLEESDYNHEKPIRHNFAENVSLKLWGNSYEKTSLTEKNSVKKHYETLWPQNKTDKEIVNTMPQNTSPVCTAVKSESLLHNSSLNIKNSDTKLLPPPKPKLPALGKVLSKSKSSSALFFKMNDKNPASNESNKFKDMSVNKVVCELNSILNVLTTRPFKSSQKETTSSSEKSSNTEMSQNRQSNLSHPLAPPRRKPRYDTVEAPYAADSELQGPYASIIKSFKLPEKSVITSADLKPSIHHLSKSATMSDINKVHFVDSRERNISLNVEKCAKTDDPVVSPSIENSGRLPSVYENVDCVQSPTVSIRNDVKTVFQKPPSKINKLKHSCSDASVFSVLRKSKCLNKVLTNQDQQPVFHEVKSETKSYIKKQDPIVSKQMVTPIMDKTQQIVKLQQKSLFSNKQQLITCSKKVERRSMDDMDAFPIAPPRTRRRGPTPQKNVAEMEKFTSSLDEGNFQSQKVPSS